MNVLITALILIVGFMVVFGGLYGFALLLDQIGIIEIVEDDDGN